MYLRLLIYVNIDSDFKTGFLTEKKNINTP